jgi:phage recombination protein Bet
LRDNLEYLEFKMSNELATTKPQKREQQIRILQNSLYPGASQEGVELVLQYCEFMGLDVMLKPVYPVPMWNKNTKSMRDVVMPGIGLYRIQAARTGQYAGITEPEFGPDETQNLSGVSVTFPRFCRITVKRAMGNGVIAEFAAVERWIENYATGGKDTAAPNAMWLKRPYGQLAKCAEAQALRKAFPEVGEAPTVEEMEGKAIEGYAERLDKPAATTKQEKTVLPPWPDENFASTKKRYVETNGSRTPDQIIMTLSVKYTLSDEQKRRIRDLAIIESVIDEPQENPVIAALERAITDAEHVDDVLEAISVASDYVQSKAITADEFAAIQQQAEDKKEELLV